MPPHWNIYFTVSNVEETIAAVGQNGGTVVFGPMDVFEAGRMAMCQDPQGALFAIWQPKLHIGARIKYETGAMCWNELLTTDRAAAIEFYVNVLGMERGEWPRRWITRCSGRAGPRSAVSPKLVMKWVCTTPLERVLHGGRCRRHC